LWEEDEETGDATFKVALHGINKALEPERKSHTETHFINRIGLTYKLNANLIWIDSDAFEQLIALGNQFRFVDPNLAQIAYSEAIKLSKGEYLPDRLYEDWSCDERERLQVLALGGIITLAELLIEQNPIESIRLCQKALLIDFTWEDAYRIQMDGFFRQGNRPMAIKTYQICESVLKKELNIQPLPQTKKLYAQILNA
jgi:two-component SAPR family response regulator